MVLSKPEEAFVRLNWARMTDKQIAVVLNSRRKRVSEKKIKACAIFKFRVEHGLVKKAGRRWR